MIEAVRASNGFCAALLERATPLAVEGSLVTIAFAPADDADFLLRKVNDDEYRQCVVAAVRTVTGSKPQITYVLADAPASRSMRRRSRRRRRRRNGCGASWQSSTPRRSCPTPDDPSATPS